MNIFKNSKKSFTLIEILVSTTLIAIIFMTIFSVFWSGLKVKKRSRKMAQRYMGARLILDYMAREFREAFEFNYSDYKNFKWDSDKKEVSYWGVYNDGGIELSYPGISPILRESFYVKEDEDGNTVIYQKKKPIWPLKDSRIIEGPVIDADLDLDVIYPRDPEHPQGNEELMPVKVIIYITFEEEEGVELVRNVYFKQYKKK